MRTIRLAGTVPRKVRPEPVWMALSNHVRPPCSSMVSAVNMVSGGQIRWSGRERSPMVKVTRTRIKSSRIATTRRKEEATDDDVDFPSGSSR